MQRKLVAAAVSSALALPMAAQAVEFAVSGQVNRAIISVSDATDEDGNEIDDSLQHVDSDASQSRVRFTGSEELDGGMKVGVNLELGIRDTNGGGSAAGTRTRQQHVYLDTAGGKLTLGLASAAADNMAHARLGGPSWLGGVTNWCSYGSGEVFDGEQAAACVTHDGGRRDVLRYDTPTLGPASISVSSGDDEYWDAMLKIAGSFGDAGYDLRVGHIGEYDDDTAGDITTTSAAVNFGQGTSIAASLGKRDMNDSKHTYVELDHSYGDGSIGVYWRNGEKDVDGAQQKGSLWGVGIGHNVGAGATAYAGYRQIKQDGENDNVGIIIAGMRVTFN